MLYYIEIISGNILELTSEMIKYVRNFAKIASGLILRIISENFSTHSSSIAAGKTQQSHAIAS